MKVDRIQFHKKSIFAHKLFLITAISAFDFKKYSSCLSVTNVSITLFSLRRGKLGGSESIFRLLIKSSRMGSPVNERKEHR